MKADCPQHCAANEDCINAIELRAAASRFAVWRVDPLTGLPTFKRQSMEAAAELVRMGKEVVALWQEHYRGIGVQPVIFHVPALPLRER
jgi:hypothetical protein